MIVILRDYILQRGNLCPSVCQPRLQRFVGKYLLQITVWLFHNISSSCFLPSIANRYSHVGGNMKTFTWIYTYVHVRIISSLVSPSVYEQQFDTRTHRQSIHICFKRKSYAYFILLCVTVIRYVKWDWCSFLQKYILHWFTKILLF